MSAREQAATLKGTSQPADRPLCEEGGAEGDTAKPRERSTRARAEAQQDEDCGGGEEGEEHIEGSQLPEQEGHRHDGP